METGTSLETLLKEVEGLEAKLRKSGEAYAKISSTGNVLDTVRFYFEDGRWKWNRQERQDMVISSGGDFGEKLVYYYKPACADEGVSLSNYLKGWHRPFRVLRGILEEYNHCRMHTVIDEVFGR
jgi:hypothetical protein